MGSDSNYYGSWIMDSDSNYYGLWILIVITMAGADGGAASGGCGGVFYYG